MKALFLLTLLFVTNAFAFNDSDVVAILRDKGITMEQLNAQGLQVVMGENTGHLPFSKVRVLITENEAILREEIDAVDMSGGQAIGNIKSVRFNGRYILKSDIKASVVAR